MLWLVRQLIWQIILTNIVVRLPFLWTHMFDCPLIIWIFPQTSLRSLPPIILVFSRSLNRLILSIFIFCWPIVGRYMMYFMFHYWNLPLVLYLVHLWILLLFFGLLQITLASSKLRISWIHALCTMIASLLRNFLLSSVGMIFFKPIGSHLQV